MSPQRSRPTIVWQADGSVRLWWPYHEVLLESFKQEIRSGRRWDPVLSCWVVTPVMAEAAAHWLRTSFPEHTERREEPRAAPPPPPPPPPRMGAAEPWASLHLLPSAPREVVDAAYKALARLHHPDLGGSTAAMQRVNDAYQKLRGLR